MDDDYKLKELVELKKITDELNVYVAQFMKDKKKLMDYKPKD